MLSTFLNDECDEEFKDMVVEICTHSPSLREYFSDHEILEKVVAMNEPSTAMISILCAYTRVRFFYNAILFNTLLASAHIIF